MVFSRSGSSLSYILRLKYDNRYLYLITGLAGCNCNYVGCDSYYPTNKKLKVIDLNGELINAKNVKSHVKLPLTEGISEVNLIEYYNIHYKPIQNT
ncbi:hypothetical protein GCM10009433_14170 [Psychroflexus lacisalsi]|jgi:hypothetical protein|uniref:Uncharacterized protein n=1 Tax=Psychroflexus lacisalsi TaxID=503928 RepID=A0ABP3VFG2_9FLAO